MNSVHPSIYPINLVDLIIMFHDLLEKKKKALLDVFGTMCNCEIHDDNIDWNYFYFWLVWVHFPSLSLYCMMVECDATRCKIDTVAGG